MKKVLVVLILSVLYLDAKSITATYKVSFGIFGSIGKAKAVFWSDHKRYKISIVAKATGLAKVLSGGRVESYESKGKVIRGILVPDSYKGITKTHSQTREKLYLFDHKNKRVKMIKIKTKEGKTTKSQEYLKYYANNDILSLFFNIKYYLSDFKFTGEKKLYAVGANKKDGRVDIIVPTGEKLESLKWDLGEKKGYFMKVFINQKIFASKRGELLLDLNDKGICTKAVLKDVILFGDIRGKLKNLKVDKGE